MPRTRRTYCRICEAACGLVAEVGADGRVASLKPDRDHPVSQGYVCAKGTRFTEVANHPDRLLHPMVRRADGSLERTSWDDAIATVAERIRTIVAEHGPHAVGVYTGNPLAFNAIGSLAHQAFTKTLGTRNLFNAGSQDCNNKFAGGKIVHGSPILHPIPDLAHCELAVIFGSNPWVSQASFVHLEGGVRAFQRIVERGGDVVWVDPRRTESAEKCGQHLAIRPATDVWLIFALLNAFAAEAPRERLEDPRVEGLADLLAAARDVSFALASERTGIPEAEIADLADRIRSANGTAFHLSVGVNHSGFGTLAYVALQALAYVAGNFDRRGGSVFQPAGVWGARAFARSPLTEESTSRIGGFESTMGGLPGGILADEILTDGPDRIRAMIVIAGNPVTSIPGSDRLARAFEQLDFVVAIDHFENETGRYADVLLPSSSWLERWDLALTTVPLQTGDMVQVSKPVVAPAGESRNDTRIFADLALALGGSARWKAMRLPFDRLPAPRYGWPGMKVKPGSYLGKGPVNRGRRVRFWVPALADDVRRLEEAARAEAPFVLLGRRRKLGHNSWIQGATRDGNAEPIAWMTKSDLAALGLPEGGDVRIDTDAGQLVIRADAADGISDGTVVVPHGVPGINVNAILPDGPDHIERLSGQHVMTGIPARVAAAAAVDAQAV